MDNLIVMTPRVTGDQRPAPHGGSAEILFFTGVRYFRQVEEADFLPVAPAPRRRRRRPAKVKMVAEVASLEQQHA